jgi:hypothetical protein
MPDLVYGALDLLANLTVSDTAFAPAEEGQPNNIINLEASANERWYQGALLGIYDPIDYAQTADACLSGDCDPWRVGGAALPVLSGGIVKKVGPELAETTVENATKLVGHHTIPREILKTLPEDIYEAVKGKKGAPNIWDIPEELHKQIHRGTRGGPFNATWRESMEELEEISVKAILEIREKIVKDFDLDKWNPYPK